MAITTNKAIKMSKITTCDAQMAFFDRIDAMGYKAKVDYADSYREDTITVLSEAMASDVRVIKLFKSALGV